MFMFSEINRAARILQAMRKAHDSQKGAVGLDGTMIDAPMIKQASLHEVLANAPQSYSLT